MRTGRPTKYDPSFVTQVTDYIKTTGREQTALPSMEGFAGYLGVDTDTLNEWAKLYPDFSGAIKELKEKQKEQLMTDGMYGGKEVNSTMAIFLLKANHGMIETSHLDVTSAGNELKAPHITIDTHAKEV